MILGEQESNGEHAWFGGEDGPRREVVEVDDSSESPASPAVDPRLSSPQDPNASTEDEEPGSNEDGNTPKESAAEKRHRESESAQAGINLSKKQKVSGAGAIDKIGDSINNLAETLERNHSNAPSEQVIIHKQALADATVGSTIQGLAAEKVQDEACLTPEGQIFMLDLLDKESLARTYMALKSEKLRTMWLKKQLVQNDGDLEELFIDWENESQH
jgi:hypothetical protein